MGSSQSTSTHDVQQRTSIDQLIELSKKGEINKALYKQLAAELSRFPELQAYDLLQRLEVKTVLQGFGGFSDIYHGILKVDPGQTMIDPDSSASSPSDPQLQVKVAVKQLRMFATSGSEEDPRKVAKVRNSCCTQAPSVDISVIRTGTGEGAENMEDSFRNT